MSENLKINKYIKAEKDRIEKYGYKLHGNAFYKIENDIYFCFRFQNLTSVHFDYYFIPLFIKSEFEYFTYGGSKNNLKRNETGEGYPEYVNDVFSFIENEVIPFYDSISEPKKLLSIMKYHNKTFKRFVGFWNAFPEYSELILKLYLELYTGKKREYLKDAKIIAELLKDKTQESLDTYYKDFIEAKPLLNMSEDEIQLILKENVNYSKTALKLKE